MRRKLTAHQVQKLVKRKGNSRNWTERDVDDIAGNTEPVRKMVRVKKEIQAAPKIKRFRSKLEARYADYLNLIKAAGEITNWEYEPDRLELAHRTTYTPDFKLTYPDGHIEYHETKGYKRSTGEAKLKIAARLFPDIPFFEVQWIRERWVFTEKPK